MKEEDLLNAFKLIVDKFGWQFASIIEQVFRNETNHFKSSNFLKTFSAGMEAFSDVEPYGWSSAKQYWRDNKAYAPVGIYKQVENSSAILDSRGVRRFIQFASLEASLMTVAHIINIRGGNGGSWFSVTDKAAQAKYNAALNQIIPRFVNQLKQK